MLDFAASFTLSSRNSGPKPLYTFALNDRHMLSASLLLLQRVVVFCYSMDSVSFVSLLISFGHAF